MKNLFVLIILLSILPFANAQIPDHSFYSLTLEEDIKPIVLFSNTEDRNYTLGLSLTYGNSRMNSSFITKPNRWFLRTLMRENNLRTASIPSISLAGTGFTPDDLTRSDIVYGDRPYAFLLYISCNSGAYNQEFTKYSDFTINYGYLGLNTGEKVQSFVHGLLNSNNTKPPYNPKGWDNQVSNGGEPTLLLTLSQNKLISSYYRSNRRNYGYQTGIGYRAMIGYYNAASVNLFTRIGFLDRHNWMMRSQPTSTGNQFTHPNIQMPRQGAGFASPITTRGEPRFELYAFGNSNLQVMMYNALLRGQFVSSKYTLSSDQVNNAIIEWSIGIGFTYYTRNRTMWNILWTMNSGRTSELNTIFKRAHTWGGITITREK